MANSKFARASRAGHRAGKPGSAAYKAAFRKAFKGRGSGGGKRKAPRKTRRRAARRATKAPRRRRTRMAKKRRSGGRRKALKITPKFILKAGVFLAGLKLINDGDLKGFLGFVSQNPKALLDPKLYAEAARRFGPGALVAFVGPKVADKGVQMLNKGLPGANRLSNAVLVRV